jgi:hypothetical protein
MTDIETSRAALVEKLPLRMQEMLQGEGFVTYADLASAPLAVALEQAAKVCDPKGYCSEMDTYGEYYASAIRALKGTE